MVEPDSAVSPEPSHTEALDAADADLRAVEAALGRIDAGSYGHCEVCGGEIPADTLAGAPLTRACPAHAVA